ncbi:2-methylcitrate dehydratase FeS dependent [Vibrio variabilis]|uniref:aconitate hydratase n=1 Tax=Vibrio variabilis TaxID=990271 RepID=A0ABQ0JJC4_9VIBR|nr:2-methylcitrate dehydratase FeS dependent [Vibrio variabilis]
MTPEYGASAGMFYIDEQTINYLKLTGRDDEQVKLVEQYAKQTGLWADELVNAEYERVLEFDLSKVERTLAGPSNPHRRLPTAQLNQQGISGEWQQQDDKMPDGAVIIAAITSCTNTSNPRNVVAAGLIAKKANQLGLLRNLGLNPPLLRALRWQSFTYKSLVCCLN